jgi:hypothetical protein
MPQLGAQRPSGFNPSIGVTVTPKQGIYEQSATQLAPLGTRLEIGGRTFYYASAGAALVAGMICETAAFGGSSATIQTNLTIPSVTDGSNAAGQNKVTVTLTTDAATLDQYAEGYLTIYDGTAAQGVGQTYRIRGNEVGTAGSSCVLTLYDDLVIAISTSAKANLNTNIFRKVKVSPITTPLGAPVGVPLIAVTSGYYFWLQTWGPVCCLLSGAGTSNTQLVRGTAATGAAQVQIAGSSSIVNVPIGFLINLAIADTKYGLVFLQIMF